MREMRMGTKQRQQETEDSYSMDSVALLITAEGTGLTECLM